MILVLLNKIVYCFKRGCTPFD
uniref:Uncharacterized protein n=1 Tax=Anguilla anguilla TaxID=7936 RepID=A0A0E9W034_ANGAN